MDLYRIIDADAHMSEPFEMWASRIAPKFRDRAPRLVRDYGGKSGAFFVFEDFVTHFSSEREGASQDMKRPGGWDPAERLKDMELEGIDAAVLYTTYGFTLFACQDAELMIPRSHPNPTGSSRPGLTRPPRRIRRGR